MLLLATVLPLLALVSAAHNPPHLRHRRLAHSIQQREDVSGAKEIRDNAGHAEAHRLIKRTVVKRGQTCRPKQKAQAAQVSPASAAAASPSPTIDTQNALAQHPKPVSSSSSSSTTTWQAAPSKPAPPPAPSPPPPAPSPPAPKPQPGNNSGGQISINDGKCGWCDANGDQPNGAQEWLNCGLKTGGWTPPHVSIDQLITKDLNPHGVFAACSQYFDLFYQYGGEFQIPPIMLASFAMQESTCNAGATGGGGEVGLMQIGPSNCENGVDACRDVHYNVRRGAQLFRKMINDNGGNVIAALGSYNGWRVGMTMDDATRAKSQGNCLWQNNLDYLTQWLNGWILDKNGYSIGSYFNLRGC